MSTEPGDPIHLDLDAATAGLVRAAVGDRVALVIYDNPDRQGDEYVRLVQPMRFVQSRSNLLVLCWQYGPRCQYLTFSLSSFRWADISPYPALFSTADTLNLDLVVPWGEQERYTQKACPFDRRRAVNRDAEIFFIDAANAMQAQYRAGLSPSFPDIPESLNKLWFGQGQRTASRNVPREYRSQPRAARRGCLGWLFGR